MRKIVLVAFVLAFVMAGCGTAPVQKPTQTIAPDSTTAAALKDVQAQTVALAQQNTAIINAIQKSAQDADQFRTEVKGSVASLTQNQFRLDSWWAEVSARVRPRVLGFGGFHLVGADEATSGLAGEPGSSGVGGVPALGGNAHPVSVKSKGGEKPMWTYIVVAFIFLLIGVAGTEVFDIYEAKYAQIIETREHSILTWIVGLIHNFVALFVGKKKTAAPATPPAPPTPPTPPATGT